MAVSRTSPPARRRPGKPSVSTEAAIDRPGPAVPESNSELLHRVAILEEEARGLRLQNEALRTDLSQANDELEWRRALADDDDGATYSYEQETEVFEAERERAEAEAVAEVAEEELRAVRARGLQLGGDLLKRTEELADLRAAKSRLEEELRKADVRYKVLEARAFDTEALLAAAKERAAECLEHASAAVEIDPSSARARVWYGQALQTRAKVLEGGMGQARVCGQMVASWDKAVEV